MAAGDLTLGVFCCTYNGAAYLRQQLDSLTTQTRRPDDLVIVDDASSDTTADIARQFAASAPFPVRVEVNVKNLGLIRNFSRGLELARGSVLLPCDQDDIWLPGKLAAFEAAFGSGDTGLAFCDALVVDETLRPVGHTHWEHVDFNGTLRERAKAGAGFDVLLRHCFVAAATMGLAARLRDLILPVPPFWQFDAWAAMVAASVSSTVLIPETLNHYRQHAGQVFGGRRKGIFTRYREARAAVDASYYHRSAEMIRSLRTRLLEQGGLAAGSPVIRKLEEKARFCDRRAAMRQSLLKRYPLLLSELLAGRYHRYGQGWRSAAVDALI